jgi:hypothetical protein
MLLILIVFSFPSWNILQVEGVRFDVITECSGNLDALLSGADTASIFPLIDKLNPVDRRTGEHPWEVWMQTLAGDNFEIEGGSFEGYSEVLKLETRWSYITRSFRQWVLSKALDALQSLLGPEPERYKTLGDVWYAQYELVTKSISADRGDNTGIEYWRSMQEHFSLDGPKHSRFFDLQNTVKKEAELFRLLLRRHAIGSLGGTLARTRDHDNLCLVRRSAQIGDEIWFVQGSKMPMVLRSGSRSGRYTFIGEAYVHNFMQGEYFLQEPNAIGTDGFTQTQIIEVE